MSSQTPSNARRRWLARTVQIGASAAATPLLARTAFATSGTAQPASPGGAPGTVSRTRPTLPYGLQFGDPRLAGSGRQASAQTIAWTRADSECRVLVEWSLDARFSNARKTALLSLSSSTDFTGRVDLQHLPPGREVFVRMTPESLDRPWSRGEPMQGSFTTPSDDGDVRFVWGGDVAGQGWGSSPTMGGMTAFRAMLQARPQFFIHSGDTIYADGILKPTQVMPDGRTWTNVVTPEKSKVAETLDEFRGNYRYNLMDEHVRAFNQCVPQIWQWDDHEVTNNWSDSKDLSTNALYTEKEVRRLTVRAAQAWHEFAPMRRHGDEEPDRVYRQVPYGRHLDVFMLDMRSYRAANSANLQPEPGRDTDFLGPVQLEWLKRSLKQSRATWKVIGADMPIGLQVPDGKDAAGVAQWEAIANGESGPPRGRELEIADLLAFIRRERIRNVVWLTADVHYCAAHHYTPERANFKSFDPFWEFVAGPLHSGAFGPNPTDPTFGPEVVFQKGPAVQNEPPLDHNQFFGQVDIDGASGEMLVQLKDRSGAAVYQTVLSPG